MTLKGDGYVCDNCSTIVVNPWIGFDHRLVSCPACGLTMRQTEGPIPPDKLESLAAWFENDEWRIRHPKKAGL